MCVFVVEIVRKYMGVQIANILCWCWDIAEADKLCGRLYQKLNSILGQKVVMDHMPLLMVCLEVSLDKFY